MENITKAVNVLVLLFKLVSGILNAVQGEQESEETREILSGVGNALTDFATTVEKIAEED